MTVGADLATGPRSVRVRGWLGRHALPLAAGGFVALSLPVLWRGAPLADDFTNCLRPAREGLGPTLISSWERLGAIRPARFVEILLTTGVCERLPFGVAIAVPLALTLVVAWLLRGLLRDVGVPGRWPDAAAVGWLLQPLGTEAALWPAALHVPLGLVLALGALRLLRRGHLGWGVAAAVAAFGSAEQTILALPIATWLVVPAAQRRRATIAVLAAVAVTAMLFLTSPGDDHRLQASLVERLTGLVDDPAFYVLFPAVGIGAHSIPLAAWWAVPWSLLVLGAGAAAGWWLTADHKTTEAVRSRLLTAREVLFSVALVLAANTPVLLNVSRQGPPRVFAPTWLLLVALAAIVASRMRWRRPRLAGSLTGLAVAGALLSLALSVSVRLTSANFVEAGTHHIAARTTDGDVVALCDVPRTVVDPAPRGGFAVHEFLFDWAAADAITYYTDREVTVRLAASGCPDTTDADLVVEFDDLAAHAEGG